MLRAMAEEAKPDSDECAFAHRHLAELLVDDSPWQAAVFARRVLLRVPDDERAWATMALAQTLLGNYPFAQRAYLRAIAKAPNNPWYAHNLGHLLDVALDRPDEALPLLRFAFEQSPDSAEIAASYGHVLARTSQLAMAHRVLSLHGPNGPGGEQARLLAWVERGAPKAQTSAASESRYPEARPLPVRRRQGLGQCKATLLRGLARLPFSEAMKAVAVRALEQALFTVAVREASSVREYCAACALLAHQSCAGPLSAREIAAPFGARVANVRALSEKLLKLVRID
jgi:hypothetical protein